ncbi:hypothetical protein DMX02_10385 [Pseudomonas jessenii]|nr:hypothetical protein DMX02_10385 [Pseudomonas jessenii]
MSAVFLWVSFLWMKCTDAFASKLAPTFDRIPNVGASLLAKGPLIVPTLCVGMQPGTLRVPIYGL